MVMSHSSGGAGTRVAYISNLPGDIREVDIRHFFKEEDGFGHIVRVSIKSGAPNTAYAFLDFETASDAEDAVERRNGVEFEGEVTCVERGEGRPACGGGGQNHYGQSRRVIVTGFPSGTAWQDLKDYMRRAGDVAFVGIEHPGMAVVRYNDPANTQEAVRRLNRTVFTDCCGEHVLRVQTEEACRLPRSHSGSRYRSRSRHR
eukprot:NODE_18450_length_893_cov_1.872063.p1 GENE.NODE_18450_length_893_cov_1.872063~~NODE_18450_length_893_cov_1.872063.p1  ORF type:complete len:202 (-),score=28.42 NODE_18450_length_893_cov_1.872063:206-811(-)